MASKPKVQQPQTDPKIQQQYTEIERTRMALQRQASNAQKKELGLLRKQINSQTSAYQQQLGLLSSQVAQSNTAATAQQGLYDTQQAEAEKQQRLAEQEQSRANMQQGIDQSNVATNQLRMLRTYSQRSSLQRGLLSGSNSL